MWGLGRLVLIVGALALSAVALWQYAARWAPSRDHYPVQGVDVSAADGAIDWNMVAATGADFGYVVATSGAGGRGAAFEANWRGIAAAGIRRGAVLVYSLCQPGVAQANVFNTMVPADADALPPAIDLSYDAACTARPEKERLVADLSEAARRIEAHMGKPVLLRVSRGVEADYALTAAVPRNIWATGNFLRPDYAACPWRMWRASDRRRVDGITGPANWDVAAP